MDAHNKELTEEIERFKKVFKDSMNGEGKTVEERLTTIEACLVQFMEHQTLHCEQIHSTIDLVRIIGLYIGINNLTDARTEEQHNAPKN